MKKLISLLLTLLLCLSVLLPAAAEETAPALNLPISLEDYKTAYETLLTTVVPGCTVTWSTMAMEGDEVWLGTINDSFIGVMLLAKDDMASEICALMQADLSENTLMTFLSMAGYAGAALLTSDAVAPEAACDAFFGEVFGFFSATIEGSPTEDIYGLPGGISISPMEDGTYQYYFILKLDAAEAE